MQKTYVASLGMHILETEITNKCNKNCSHCYNRGEDLAELPLKKIIELVDFAEKYQVGKFVFSGGEACLHGDFQTLCEHLKEREKSLTKRVLHSNGSIADIDICYLKSFDIIHLSFELDDTKVRTISQQHIIDQALRLKKNDIYCYFFATIHSRNIDKIEEMIELANGVGIDIAFNMYVDVGGAGELCMNPEQIKEATIKLHQFYMQEKILRHTSPLVAIVTGQKSPKYIGIKGGCTAGIAACAVKANGKVIPCPFLRVESGNVFNDDLKNIWFKSSVFNTLRQRQLFKGKCNGCNHLSFCGGCRVRSFKSSGELDNEDPACFI